MNVLCVRTTWIIHIRYQSTTISVFNLFGFIYIVDLYVVPPSQITITNSAIESKTLILVQQSQWMNWDNVKQQQQQNRNKQPPHIVSYSHNKASHLFFKKSNTENIGIKKIKITNKKNDRRKKYDDIDNLITRKKKKTSEKKAAKNIIEDEGERWMKNLWKCLQNERRSMQKNKENRINKHLPG